MLGIIGAMDQEVKILKEEINPMLGPSGVSMVHKRP